MSRRKLIPEKKFKPLDLSDLGWDPAGDGQARFVIFQSNGQTHVYAVDECPGCQGSGKVDTVERVCSMCRGQKVVYTPTGIDQVVREFKAPVLSIEDVSIDYDFLIRNAGDLGGH